MKYYIIAGEASGDLHGSNLMKELKLVDEQAEFRYFGGDLMKSQGGTLVKHYKETAFMGFLAVIKNLGTIKKNFTLCETDLLEFAPDVLILIDYPGFNLRMAEFAKKHGIKVYYYISPKIWAWKQGRIKKIKAFVDEMFTILPFETAFFKQFDYPIHYVGNPSVDGLSKRPNQDEDFNTFIKRNNLKNRPIVALLSGSRKQEIHHNLPEMLKMVAHFPEYQFVIAGAPSLDLDLYKGYIGDHDVSLVFDETYELLQQSSAALVTSGTATLETAIMNIPQIVCYKMAGGRLFFEILKLIVKVRLVSLVNLIMEKMIVLELLQHHVNEDELKAELQRILKDESYREAMLNNYEEMRRRLGGPGAARNAAQKMAALLKQK
ncbi:lipid-A-disaccharide synthase [Puteibacter caeruleilacunae]|nr:lipid-A-disaccharide synthase [Puteibacter caeruleilacunae]